MGVILLQLPTIKLFVYGMQKTEKFHRSLKAILIHQNVLSFLKKFVGWHPKVTKLFVFGAVTPGLALLY